MQLVLWSTLKPLAAELKSNPPDSYKFVNTRLAWIIHAIICSRVGIGINYRKKGVN